MAAVIVIVQAHSEAQLLAFGQRSDVEQADR